ATIGGNVATNGGSEVTEYGVCWGTSASPETSGTKWTMGTGTGYFSDSMGGLTPGITYYVKAFATNTMGTAYGNETSFITLGEAPMVLNLGAMDITPSGATLRASVTSNKLLTTVTFEYGLTDSYGNTLLATENPDTEQEDTVLATLTGLSVEVTYHFRVKAENELGVVYSTDTTFTTVLTGITGSISDAEGNNYGTIGIGHQIWMTSNLKTVLFNDSDSIPSITADSLWSGMNTAGYCWYLNDVGYKNTYGALYNWYTVNTQKLCPTGWHVPSEADWTELVDYLGGASMAGGLLKESGTSHWKTPNEGATNEYGFTALPGGKRLDSGEFDFMQVEGNFWSSESFSTQNASYLFLLYNYPNSLQNYANKKSGFSVRCVKD
ncbi:MAG: fibrobacter succinogenes major paralogous domain-containing protein, partial [Salinivirgaceae bacterium]|nr:fibrobacter succinogenes major paralogous domain-containing protein [Salinivirgaceae bacterium]